mmetsp:Transcript_50090/g.102146  ORF Transcript_50090/g.102146 Transcript_50090/m.102146 type:complete len:299 (-) Transcript_50090:65-961(-)
MSVQNRPVRDPSPEAMLLVVGGDEVRVVTVHCLDVKPGAAQVKRRCEILAPLEVLRGWHLSHNPAHSCHHSLNLVGEIGGVVDDVEGGVGLPHSASFHVETLGHLRRLRTDTFLITLKVVELLGTVGCRHEVDHAVVPGVGGVLLEVAVVEDALPHRLVAEHRGVHQPSVAHYEALFSWAGRLTDSRVRVFKMNHDIHNPFLYLIRLLGVALAEVDAAAEHHRCRLTRSEHTPSARLEEVGDLGEGGSFAGTRPPRQRHLPHLGHVRSLLFVRHPVDPRRIVVLGVGVNDGAAVETPQ